MNLTYRTRQRLKFFGLFFGILVLVSTLIWLGWLVYMGRYVVYSDEGARFDENWQVSGQAEVATEPYQDIVSIVMNDGEEILYSSTELKKASGSYVTNTMLLENLEEVATVVRQIPKGSTILLDMKSASGSFYYNTNLPGTKTASGADLEKIGELISYLAKADYYLVARIPAFRDRNFGLENTKYGLFHTSGMYLWSGDDNCYWLDPTKTGTIDYLTSIVLELKRLGFDEVVFTDFCFPPTTDILFEGSQIDALNEAARILTENCATATFALGFVSNDPAFVLPQGRTRLYRTDVDAAQAASIAAASGVENIETDLVFLTEAMDTRFDQFGVLRPLAVGIVDIPGETTAPPETSEPETQE